MFLKKGSHQLPISSLLYETVGPSVRGFMLCITTASSDPRRFVAPCDLIHPHQTKAAKGNLISSVDPDGLAHGRLDMQRLDVLPILLQERNEEINAQHDIGENLVVVHFNMANSDAQAEDLLELEFDSGAYFRKLVREIFSVRDGSREFSSLGKTGTQKTGNLLDQGFRSEEGVVLLCELLHELFVFVQLFKIVNRHVLKFNLLCTIDISGVCEDADGHARSGDIREFDCSGETLISLWVVVLQTDLKFDRLRKITLLLRGCMYKQILDRAPHA